MIALRSTVFGVITVGLTVLAHAAAGGGVPSPAALAVLMLVTGAVGAPLFRRGLRPAALVPVAGAAQVGLHPVFQGLAGGMDPAQHVGHGSPLVMLGAHVVAGVLAVLLVTTLDPVLRCLRLRGTRLLVGLGVVRVGPVTESRPVLAGDDLVVTSRLVVLAAPRRGPPCGAASSCLIPPRDVRSADGMPGAPECGVHCSPQGSAPFAGTDLFKCRRRRLRRRGGRVPPAGRGTPFYFFRFLLPCVEESSVLSKSFLRACARTVVVTAGVAALSLTGALAASAHVTVSATRPRPVPTPC